MPDISRTVNQRPLWLDDKTKSIMDRAIAREQSLSRLLMTYIITGLIFMLLPGTFLGVWNLIKISSREAAESISPAWIQAHGHAQVFGWVGTFILGIGFYSIPKLRKLRPFALWSASRSRTGSRTKYMSASFGRRRSLRWPAAAKSLLATHQRYATPASARHGVELSRQTTCGWAMECADLFQPLYELMIAEVLASYVVNADDTTVKIRDAQRKLNLRASSLL